MKLAGVEKNTHVTGLRIELAEQMLVFTEFPETSDISICLERSVYICMQIVSSTQYEQQVECVPDVDWNAKL